MLSERRWSDTSSALKFFKSKANHFTSSTTSTSSSSSSTPSSPSTSTHSSVSSTPTSSSPHPSSSSSSSFPFSFSSSSPHSSAAVSPPVVTVISDDFLSTDMQPFFTHTSQQLHHPAAAAASRTGNGVEDGAGEGARTSPSCPTPPTTTSSSSSSSSATDDSVPDFPAGELRHNGLGSGTENFIRRLWRKKKSLTINEYDPSFKVIYLGNVLTGWAKGDGCVDRPLATLWKNYKAQNGKQEIQMKLTVTNSGLKAVTKEHGLTEYWSNRVTFCNAHPRFPKVFCWVYRHEGRRLKQELRCHAVLCPNEAKAAKLAQALQERLQFALQEFRRDKLNRQKARLSLANCVYDVPSLPRRKQLLSTGMHNYRPPLERSKSAPKLKSIEEGFEEAAALEDLIEEEEELEETVSSSNVDNAAVVVAAATAAADEDDVGPPPKPRVPGNDADANDDDEDAEDEVSFAYNLDKSCGKCVRGRDRCDCRCPPCDAADVSPETTAAVANGYGDLPGQLLDVVAAAGGDGDGGSGDSSSTSSASPPSSPTTLLPRGSLPARVEPGPVRPAPSPEPSRSSFSMGSPVCPGRRRRCAAGLCDEPLCRGRSGADFLRQLPADLAGKMARLSVTDGDGDGDVEVECNNNRVVQQNNKVRADFADEKDILKAVTIAGLVGCFRQSKA